MKILMRKFINCRRHYTASDSVLEVATRESIVIDGWCADDYYGEL